MAAGNIFSHFVLYFTMLCALTGWILNIIGLSIRTDYTKKGVGMHPLSLYWWYHWFYFLTILLVLGCIWKAAVDTYRFLIISFLTISFIFLVNDINDQLRASTPSEYDKNSGFALSAAGTIIMSLAFIPWIVIIGSDANSKIHRWASLTLPTRRHDRTDPAPMAQV